MEENLEYQTQTGIRKYFANKKEYIIRIRSKGDILYYKGIKILELSKSCLKVSDDVFQFNKASIDKTIKEKNNKEREVREVILSQIKEMRQELLKAGNLFIDKTDCNIKIERKYKKSLSEIEHEGLNKILEYLDNCNTIKVDIDYLKKYRLKKREELSTEEDEELDEKLRKIVEKRRKSLSQKLGTELKILTNYQQNQFIISEEELKNYSSEEKSQREKTWNKEYVLSYTLSSSKSFEQKKEIQEKLCADENFDDNKIKEIVKGREEYFEFKDYIIYHLKFNTNDEKSKVEDELANIEYEIIRNRIYDKNLGYHQLSEPTFSTIKGISLPISKITNFEDIDNITTKMENIVEKYIEFVKEEVEKLYQFQFMIQDETKMKIKNANMEAKNQVIYPFEQELFILNRKGRIDAIFFGIKENTADLYLIELKVNESVIGGTNGVHKHLSDICKLLSQEKIRENFLYNSENSLLKVLNYRLKELGEHNPIEKFDKIHFWTIVGYTDNKHKETSEKLLRFYYNHVPSEQTKFELKKIKSENLALKSIDISIPKTSKSLKDYIEELNGKYNIDVKFFLDKTDETYHIGNSDFESLDL